MGGCLEQGPAKIAVLIHVAVEALVGVWTKWRFSLNACLMESLRSDGSGVPAAIQCSGTRESFETGGHLNLYRANHRSILNGEAQPNK